MRWEPLGQYRIAVSDEHRFGTDALLLAHFAASKRAQCVCDIGAGCGIIPLLLLQQPHPPTVVVGLELQPEAVALFSQSIAENGLSNRAQVQQVDIRVRDGLPQARFDKVICNPPYFSPGSGQVSEEEPHRLARHEGVGCTLCDVALAAGRLLRYGGTFCLCHRPERLCDVVAELRAAGLEPKRLCFVQQTADSAPWLLLCEAKKGGKPGLTVLPPWVLNENGAPTPLWRDIYQNYEKEITP